VTSSRRGAGVGAFFLCPDGLTATSVIVRLARCFPREVIRFTALQAWRHDDQLKLAMRRDRRSPRRSCSTTATLRVNLSKQHDLHNMRGLRLCGNPTWRYVVDLCSIQEGGYSGAPVLAPPLLGCRGRTRSAIRSNGIHVLRGVTAGEQRGTPRRHYGNFGLRRPEADP